MTRPLAGCLTARARWVASVVLTCFCIGSAAATTPAFKGPPTSSNGTAGQAVPAEQATAWTGSFSYDRDLSGDKCRFQAHMEGTLTCKGRDNAFRCSATGRASYYFFAGTGQQIRTTRGEYAGAMNSAGLEIAPDPDGPWSYITEVGVVVPITYEDSIYGHGRGSIAFGAATDYQPFDHTKGKIVFDRTEPDSNSCPAKGTLHTVFRLTAQ